jgi:lipopolysaccharide export system permease protein
VKKLYKLIIQSFAGPFFLTFFIVIFLLLMQFLWKYIDDLAGKGLTFDVLGELMFYVAASLVPLALPLAILLASLMTMGNLGENFELTAMKASGISLPRIVAPLVGLSLFLTVGAFLFSNYILPYTNLKMVSLLYDITNQRPELQIREGVFYGGIDNYSIRVNKRNYKTNMLYDLKIYDHTTMNGNTYVTIADSGKMVITPDKKYLQITLFDGHSYEDVVNTKRKNLSANTYPFRRDKFKKEVIVQELVGFGLNRSDQNLFRSNYRMLSLRQLNHQADSLQKKLDLRSNELYNQIMYAMILRYRSVSNIRPPQAQPQQHQPRPPIPLPQQQAPPPQIRQTQIPQPGTVSSGSNASPDIAHPVVIKNAPDPDNVLSQMQIYERVSVVTEALSYARDTKSYISANSVNVDDQARLIRKHDIEWWKKFTLSVSCLIFFLIGAPLGAIIRKGGLGMPVVISVLFFVLWYILTLTSEKFVREGIVSSAVGMWSASIFLFMVGIFLTRKATLDSSIFNIDTYLNPFKKFINKYTPKNIKFKNIPSNK